EREAELPRVLVHEAEVVQAERDRSPVAPRAAHDEAALRELERARVVAAQPVELSDVVDGAGDPAIVGRVVEELQRRLQVLRRLLEAPRLAVQATDPAVRRAPLRAQIEAERAREHLAEDPERLLFAPEHLEDVAVVMERVDSRLG